MYLLRIRFRGREVEGSVSSLFKGRIMIMFMIRSRGREVEGSVRSWFKGHSRVVSG